MEAGKQFKLNRERAQTSKEDHAVADEKFGRQNKVVGKM